MTLITGMGETAERANVMSRQLTQLGYDIASFYNIDVADAMAKIQSGIAGELEPLRRIGWDLSDAPHESGGRLARHPEEHRRDDAGGEGRPALLAHHGAGHPGPRRHGPHHQRPRQPAARLHRAGPHGGARDRQRADPAPQRGAALRDRRGQGHPDARPDHRQLPRPRHQVRGRLRRHKRRRWRDRRGRGRHRRRGRRGRRRDRQGQGAAPHHHGLRPDRTSSPTRPPVPAAGVEAGSAGSAAVASTSRSTSTTSWPASTSTSPR